MAFWTRGKRRYDSLSERLDRLTETSAALRDAGDRTRDRLDAMVDGVARDLPERLDGLSRSLSDIQGVMSVRDLVGALPRARAEAIMRTAAGGNYMGDHVSLCTILGSRPFYVDTREIGIAPHLVREGFWEYWVTDFFAAHVGEGDAVLDVGANLGYFTILAGELVGASGRVDAVEANPHIFELLRRNVSVNGHAERTRLHGHALAAETGRTEFFVPRDNPGGGGMPQKGRLQDRVEGDTIEVDMRPLDASGIDRLDFVKIDVEGAELIVLDGIAPLLERFAPKVICEVNFSRGYGFGDVVDRLGTDGCLLHLTEGGEVAPLTEAQVAAENPEGEWMVVRGVPEG